MESKAQEEISEDCLLNSLLYAGRGEKNIRRDILVLHPLLIADEIGSAHRARGLNI